MSPLIAELSTSNSTSLFNLLREGGWAMIPLGIISSALLILIFYCWQTTSNKGFFPMGGKSTKETIWDELIELKQKYESKFAEKLESRIEQIEEKKSQMIAYLNVIASISPMVGLLGTVSGMIGAFQTIATGGMGKPEKLAGDIGEALITTATGLVIAIPAMIAFFAFRNRLECRMQELCERVTDELVSPKESE